jgi:hypothetical protein
LQGVPRNWKVEHSPVPEGSLKKSKGKNWDGSKAKRRSTKISLRSEKGPEKDGFSVNFTEEIEQTGEYRNLTPGLNEAGRLLGTPALFN